MEGKEEIRGKKLAGLYASLEGIEEIRGNGVSWTVCQSGRNRRNKRKRS